MYTRERGEETQRETERERYGGGGARNREREGRTIDILLWGVRVSIIYVCAAMCVSERVCVFACVW